MEHKEHTLYIGTNYHPHDWDKDKIISDLDTMVNAGFNVVRLAHLCWDCFEPEKGLFTFDWFDDVLEECKKET